MSSILSRRTMAVANDVGHRLKVGDDWLEV